MIDELLATLRAVVVRIGIDLVNLENWSVITNTNRFPLSVIGNGPRISIENNYSGQMLETMSFSSDVFWSFFEYLRIACNF